MDKTDREQILTEIRKAEKRLVGETRPSGYKTHENQYFETITEQPDILFCQRLKAVGGNAYICQTTSQLKDQLTALIHLQQSCYCANNKLQNWLQKAGVELAKATTLNPETQVCITTCDFLIARFGTVLISSQSTDKREAIVMPPIHIVIAFEDQLVNELHQALQQFENQQWPASLSLITGPSRTADIEKTLVLGAHGPKELHVFLVKASKKLYF